jgi:ADP-heptose:LPS heptosyltransferase
MELRWLKNIDFFPSRPSPEELSKERSICIATKSRALGDALALTTLPRKLRELHPGLRISTYPRAFNPVVFKNNPHVSGAAYLPTAVYGDDANWGEGQLIQLKERFFALPISPVPRPELHLSERERLGAQKFLTEKRLPGSEEMPLCILHPWGSTQNNVAPVEFWDELVSRFRSRIRFWQVGVLGHGAVQGCEYYFLLPSAPRHARKLFALMNEADLFLGVDSGPMHVARAFEVPSLVLLKESLPADHFEARSKDPYFLKNHRRSAALYAENRHVALDKGEKPALTAIEQFFGQVLPTIRMKWRAT